MLLSAVVAGILTVGLSSANADEAAKSQASGSVDCQGANECKGKGDCGGPGYSCAGNNGCRGKGFVTAKSQAECEALKAKVAGGDKKKPSKSKKKKA